jgi:adenosylcobyric acid synthase
MSARKIMIQGTGSHVGKSVVTAALCRYFHQEGLRVAPFKAQNMSNNSFVTADGREMGRAQAFQAQACGIEPAVEMNPILLKPSSENGSQVIVLGKPVGVMTAREYHQYQPSIVGVIHESFEKLSRDHDIVVIEGAGSPAEINLRRYDIVNMAVAKMASAPVVLVGDINLGGVFAWLVGTLELLTEEERSLVRGLLINKFRGDISLLKEGIEFLEARTGKKVLGVLPFVTDLAVAEEDCVPESKWKKRQVHNPDKLAIEVILLPHLSNSTDFDGLEAEPDVVLHYLARPPEEGTPLPDLLILPGTKSTMADLECMRSFGMDKYVFRCREARVLILGICGGFQMLGKQLFDPDAVESSLGETDGLGLLDAITTFEPRKTTVQIRGMTMDQQEEIHAYEIHMGQTETKGGCKPLFRILEEGGKNVGRFDGVMSPDGFVWGTYLHGVFDSPKFRRRVLNDLRARRLWPPLPFQKAILREGRLDCLADLIRTHIDLPMLDRILNGV